MYYVGTQQRDGALHILDSDDSMLTGWTLCGATPPRRWGVAPAWPFGTNTLVDGARVCLACRERYERPFPRWRVRVEFVPQDLWIGVYWRRGSFWKYGKDWRSLDLYLCLLPMLPFHLTHIREEAPDA